MSFPRTGKKGNNGSAKFKGNGVVSAVSRKIN
jgi:hypothetical protein